MNACLRYLRYLARHKWFVYRAARSVGVPWLGVVHDWSKFRPSEFFPYREFFYGKPGQSAQEAFDGAWLAHIHRNKHHWQHYVLRQDDGQTKALEMPHRYAREMVADWIGAGLAITGRDNLKDWYAENRNKMLLAPLTRQWVDAYIAGRPHRASGA